MSDAGDLAEWLRRVFERRSQAETPTDILGILGSSRNDGDTSTLAQAVFSHLPDAQLINLNDYAIAPYHYHHRHRHDDFINIATLMSEAKTIVFASPVYWYSMSGQMKIFFDRLTDLTEIYKPVGKSLKNKTAFLIATGGTAKPPAAFEPPFAETARYFDMHWGGTLYAQASNISSAGESAAIFARKIEAMASGRMIRAA